ncbi:MAG: LamG-like jellyroll fold domain-containing protein [candidate division WOR-3 bacterium]|nr:LamG-like jellyroll fold domain-containing protein [candidate division WOR-3 bacterium]
MSFWLVILLASATVYEREVVVSNPAESLQTDVQIMLTLDTRSLIEAGKLDLEGNALRFFRRVQPLSYWVADGIHTCSTRIWLRLDSLFPDESKLTLLYSSSTDGYEDSFDAIFTKAQVDSGRGWVFHCDEGEGDVGVSGDGHDSLILQGVAWCERDGGGWGRREDQTFSTGSALHFEPGSFATWDMPAEACRDSFTIALWLRLDTLEHLTYSNALRILAERPDAFSLWLRQGNLCFSLQGVSRPKTCCLPPFGWERAGTPEIPPEFVPQGLATIGEELLFSAYRKTPPVSRVWRIDPSDLTLLDWFDMPPEATHTSGLAYDSTRGVLWAADYDSDKLYAIDADSSFAIHSAVTTGEFPMGVDNVSACCFATFHDTMRLVVSTWESSGQTYVLDEQASLDKGEAVVLGSYRNVGYSQGLAFDGEHLWESGLVLTQLNLEQAVEKADYKAGLLSYFSEPPYPEDITFLHDTLWMPNEYLDRAFYRLIDDPRKALGRWIHVVAVYDGQWLRLYEGGELADSARTDYSLPSISSAPLVDYSTGSNLFIGGNGEDKPSFEGTLDEIVLLPRALDSTEIRALFKRRKPLAAEPSFYLEEDVDSLPDLGKVVDKLSDPAGVRTSSSKLTLVIPYERRIRVDLFDITGRRISTLLPPTSVKDKVELHWPAGIHHGVYYVVVSSEGEAFSRKVVLFR